MTALVALWPATGRMEAWGAFGDTPDLRERGQNDGVRDLYQRMAERGEIAVYSGRITPVAQFLKDCAERLAGEKIVLAGADRFRRAEATEALETSGLRWPMQWRGQGAHAVADGSHDVRAFQNGVLAGRYSIEESLLMARAIMESSIRRDPGGNPALDKARSKGRIDALSAAVIAAGLAALDEARPRSKWRYHGLAG